MAAEKNTIPYNCSNLCKWFGGHWRTWMLISLPIVLLFLPLCPALGDEIYPYVPRYIYGLLIVALSWIFELLPIPVTAMLPVVIFPLIGIVKSSCVSTSYLNNTSFLFIGALIVACGIESCGLHKRIALFSLNTIGSNPRWMLLSCMVCAYFLGMFISNTATTAMMLPIVEQILKELGEDDEEEEVLNKIHEESASLSEKIIIGEKTEINKAFEKTEIEIETIEIEKVDPEEAAKRAYDKWIIEGVDLNDLESIPMTKQRFKIISKALSIGVPYASNIGGLATLTGNTANLILAGEFSESFPYAPPITYTSWLLYNLPASILFIFMAYFWLMTLFFGLDGADIKRALAFRSSRQEKKTDLFIAKQYKELGEWRMSEIEVFIVFVMVVLLWFFEEPGFMPGWANFFRSGFVSNSQPAILCGVILFVLPDVTPFSVFQMTQEEIDEEIARGIIVDKETGEVSGGDPFQPVNAILSWHFVEKHVPWGVVFLMGGGFSLAFCSKQAGFSCWMAQNFTALAGLPVQFIAFVVTVTTGFFTEFASNAATCALFVPILALMAKAICVNPYWLMMVCRVSINLENIF